MIHFVHDARGKPDLISVRRESRRRPLRDGALGKFSRERVFELFPGIGRARDPHRLIHVRSAAERIADGAAEAGRRAAERLDLRRVIVRFVFKHDEVFFRFAVDLRVDTDRAGVDFVGNVQIVEFAVFFQLFRRDRGEVHQAGIFVGTAAVDLPIQILIEMVRFLDRLIFGCDFDVFQLGGKRRMAAVIRPIGVDDFEFRFRRVALLRFKIVAHEGEIRRAHRKADLFMIGGDLRVRHIHKAVHILHVRALERFAL